MELKIIENIKKFIKNKANAQKENNSKEKKLHYVRNKYGFFSLRNKDK